MTGQQRMQWLFWFVLCLATVGLACTAPMPLGYDPDTAPGVPTSALLLTAEAFPEGWDIGPSDEENGESYRIYTATPLVRFQHLDDELQPACWRPGMVALSEQK